MHNHMVGAKELAGECRHMSMSTTSAQSKPCRYQVAAAVPCCHDLTCAGAGGGQEHAVLGLLHHVLALLRGRGGAGHLRC